MNFILKNKAFFILLITAFFLEGFVFNFRFYESVNYSEKVLENPYHSVGLKKYNDKKYYARENGEKYIEFEDINCELKNIYIDIKRQNYNKNKDKQKLNIVLKATDDANENFYDLPERAVIANVERSKYIKLNLLGKTEKIQLMFKNISDEDISVNKVAVNARVPFEFNILRFACVFGILFGIYLLRPKSPVYSIIYNKKSIEQFYGVGILFLLNGIIIFTFVFSNPYFLNKKSSASLQYQKLTEAIIDGHFYLDEEVSEELLEMENPYDTNKRKELKVPYKWDNAYYNGKYYVYFGITPVLLFYLPYYLLIGEHLNNEYVIFITAFILMISVFLLIRKIIDKWFKNIPYVLYILLTEVMFLSIGTVFAIKRPDFYFVPIFLAMALSMMGLYFWISSIDESRLIKWRLILGSICMALVAGARPQMVMGSFLAIPLFWKQVFKERNMFSKKGIYNTVCFLIPYIIAGAFIMYYNYARFGSVFDFGANYNLTTNDMTKRGFILGRIPTGIFMYLFQPPVYSPKFPFISSVYFYTNYMGMTIKELMFGGIFANHILLWVLLFSFRLKKYLSRKNLFYFVLCSVIFAFIIVIADTEMAGLLQRYYLDFAWFLFLPAVICVFTILDRFKGTMYYNEICCIFVGLCVLSFLYDASAFFFLGDYSTADKNPEFFYNVMHAVQFWL